MITQERLKQLLRYEPDTGKFYWKVDKARSVKAGSIAGCLRPDGYVKIRIDKRDFPSHRLAWLYVHGELPRVYIDHIDGNKANNIFSNLREATPIQNQWNMKIHKHNSSGVKGLCKRVGKYKPYWMTYVRAKGKTNSKYFPYTEDGKQEAIEWLNTTRANLHKDFARNN